MKKAKIREIAFRLVTEYHQEQKKIVEKVTTTTRRVTITQEYNKAYDKESVLRMDREQREKRRGREKRGRRERGPREREKPRGRKRSGRTHLCGGSSH